MVRNTVSGEESAPQSGALLKTRCHNDYIFVFDSRSKYIAWSENYACDRIQDREVKQRLSSENYEARRRCPALPRHRDTLACFHDSSKRPFSNMAQWHSCRLALVIRRDLETHAAALCRRCQRIPSGQIRSPTMCCSRSSRGGGGHAPTRT